MRKTLDKERLKRAEQLTQQLLRHPQLMDRVQDMLALLKVEEQSLESADDAESRIIEITRQTGRELLESWLVHKQDESVNELKTDGVTKHGKKN